MSTCDHPPARRITSRPLGATEYIGTCGKCGAAAAPLLDNELTSRERDVYEPGLRGRSPSAERVRHQVRKVENAERPLPASKLPLSESQQRRIVEDLLRMNQDRT